MYVVSIDSNVRDIRSVARKIVIFFLTLRGNFVVGEKGTFQ